jgi:phage baseplate assembly protein gpV
MRNLTIGSGDSGNALLQSTDGTVKISLGTGKITIAATDVEINATVINVNTPASAGTMTVNGNLHVTGVFINP